MAVQGSGIAAPLTSALRRADKEQTEDHRTESEAEGTGSISISVAVPPSPLLSLPFELRKRILEYVFLTASMFPPPQTLSTPGRLCGLIGHKYKVNHPGWTSPGSVNNVVQALLLCRQLHQETRLMPLQVNVVDCPAVMGSNLTATRQFLEALQPFQRMAIRGMKLHLLGSVTESWTLRSILRMMADVSDSSKPEELDMGYTRTDLRELTVVITTRDLFLAQADSLAGLLHVLTAPPASKASRPSTPFACVASWVTEGLVLFGLLRRLKIVIETSVSVASQLDADDKSLFSEFVQSVLPLAEVDIQWVVQESIISIDDHSWGSLLWHSDSIGHGWVGENQRAGNIGSAGWNSFSL